MIYTLCDDCIQEKTEHQMKNGDLKVKKYSWKIECGNSKLKKHGLELEKYSWKIENDSFVRECGCWNFQKSKW